MTSEDSLIREEAVETGYMKEGGGGSLFSLVPAPASTAPSLSCGQNIDPKVAGLRNRSVSSITNIILKYFDFC